MFIRLRGNACFRERPTQALVSCANPLRPGIPAEFIVYSSRPVKLPGAMAKIRIGDRAVTQTGVPVALSALKDWSTWLVTIQTAVLAAVGYSLGKGALLPIDRNPLVRKLLVATFITLALSIFFATWALGAIPSILLRIQENPQNTDFYHMPISGAPFFESIYGALPGFLHSCLQLWAFSFWPSTCFS
jgi:hypothetical protein